MSERGKVQGMSDGHAFLVYLLPPDDEDTARCLAMTPAELYAGPLACSGSGGPCRTREEAERGATEMVLRIARREPLGAYVRAIVRAPASEGGRVVSALGASGRFEAVA